MKDTKPRYPISLYACITALVLVVIAIIFFCFCWGTRTTVLLVRHADRQANSDALTPVGTARAQELARILEKSGINEIYTSEAIRTQMTAEPIASQLGIIPVAVPAADVAGLVSIIRNNNSGQTVLVVGHSNTVPQIITEFGGPAVIIGENEFDNLYILTLCCNHRKNARLINLQYGAASP
jgi:phosphohistidine phosphatase SixA